jgi:hypothetical protein
MPRSCANPLRYWPSLFEPRPGMNKKDGFDSRPFLFQSQPCQCNHLVAIANDLSVQIKNDNFLHINEKRF